uniref:Uncharacterized protein n=1 Tax=Ixodes ricinus TaxID=34613 RepID=A0A6B0U1Y7_IXORI
MSFFVWRWRHCHPTCSSSFGSLSTASAKVVGHTEEHCTVLGIYMYWFLFTVQTSQPSRVRSIGNQVTPGV